MPKLGDALPEGAQPLEAEAPLITGADRNASDPIRFDIGLVQRLIDAGLIGAERTAALQHECDAVAAFGRHPLKS